MFSKLYDVDRYIYASSDKYECIMCQCVCPHMFVYLQQCLCNLTGILSDIVAVKKKKMKKWKKNVGSIDLLCNVLNPM